MLALMLTLGSAQASDLEAAYQKEYAYLQAEKTALQQRTVSLAADAQRRVGEAEGELERLQGRLVRLTLEADRAEQRLGDAEREGWSAEEDADRLLTLFDQAGQSGLTLPLGSDAEKLEALFEQGALSIREGGQVRRQPGAFFLPDGTQVEGTLIRVGGIASYGVSPAGSGALAPAGEGQLQLWPEDAGEVASSLAEGQLPGTLGIFLYESLDKRVQEKADKSLADVVEGGGVVGLIILALGALALLLVLARLWILSRSGDAQALVDRIEPLVGQGRLAEALALAEGDTAAHRVVRRVIGASALEREILEDVAAEAVLREVPRIERFGAVIMVIAAVAPLLGLLGTVTGMIATFDIITEFGTGDPKMLSGGISEALITTQLGLIVAIPAVLMGNALGGRTATTVDSLERVALHLVNLLSHDPRDEHLPEEPRRVASA